MKFLASTLAILLLIGFSSVSLVAKERLFVLTDIENEPDDAQSMVRLLVYASHFDIEGLVLPVRDIRDSNCT